MFTVQFCGAGFPACHVLISRIGRLESLPHKHYGRHEFPFFLLTDQLAFVPFFSGMAGNQVPAEPAYKEIEP